MGWLTTNSLASTFLALACASTSGLNVSVAMTNAATPLFSSSILSWKLHDAHDPQSAIARSAPLYRLAPSS